MAAASSLPYCGQCARAVTHDVAGPDGFMHNRACPVVVGLGQAETPNVAIQPGAVRIWRGDAWWRHDPTDGWIGVGSQPTSAQWASAPSSSTDALSVLAIAALGMSHGQPIALVAGDGRVYLVTDEWGTPGARVLVGAQGPAALVALPPPPLVVVLRPQPYGAAGIQSSTEKVRRAIAAGRNNPFLIAWTRQTIHAANLPGARGFPDPDLTVAALFQAQKKEMAFIKDPVSGEMMANPAQLLCLDPKGLCLRGGDCDDQLIVLGSATMSAGIDARLVITRYRGADFAHITMGYETPNGWHCIDPSTDTGACSNAPYLERTIVEILTDDGTQTGGDFVGLGHLGAPPAAELVDDDEAAAWLGALAEGRELLAAARDRLAQNLGAHESLCSTLGEPPPDDAGDASRLLATAHVLDRALAEGLEGARELVVCEGDLTVGGLVSDGFGVRLVETDDGARMPVYVDAGEASSLGAALEIARRCDALATDRAELAASRLGEASALGLTSLANVDALDLQINASVAALQQAIDACPQFAAADRTAWQGFAAGWKAVHDRWTALENPPWYAPDPLRLAAALAASSVQSDMLGYQQTLASWQTRVAQQCTGFVAPPAAPTPQPAPTVPETPGSSSTPSRDIGAQAVDVAKAIGIVAAIAAGGWALFEVAKLFGWIGALGGAAHASEGRMYAQRVRLDRGGYDPDGRYWGVGAPLYYVTDEGGEFYEYVRAPDAKEAKFRVLEGKGTRARAPGDERAPYGQRSPTGGYSSKLQNAIYAAEESERRAWTSGKRRDFATAARRADRARYLAQDEGNNALGREFEARRRELSEAAGIFGRSPSRLRA